MENYRGAIAARENRGELGGVDGIDEFATGMVRVTRCGMRVFDSLATCHFLHN